MRRFPKISRLFLAFLFVMTLSIFFSSCEFKQYNVVYIVDGEVYEKEKATSKGMTLPEAPVKEGYTFDGWYWDENVWEQELTSDFTVSNVLTQDLNVYAKFTHNHEQDDWHAVSAVAATEESPGLVVFVCSVCGEQKTQKIEQLSHTHTFGDWQYDETNHWKECAKDEVKDGLAEHTFTEEITKEATEDEEGEKTLTCSVCGYETTEPIEKLPHTHTFGDWQHDETNHWKECAKDEVKDSLAEHTFIEEITKDPTEDEEGEKTLTCSVCGYEITEPIEKLPHVHTFGEWQHDDENHWKECAKDQVKDGFAEHTFEEEITKEATEDEEGEKTLTCSVCGFTKTETIDRLPHVHVFGDWQHDETNHWKECAKDEVKDSLAEHTFTEEITKDPTEDEEGEKTLTCSVCGYETTEPIEKLPHVHTFGEWQHDETNHWKECAKDEVKDGLAEHTFTEEITKEATEDEEGEKTLTCSVCGYVTTEIIERLPQTPTYTATFKADGVTIGEPVVFTADTESITEPTVPMKIGYTGAWEAYTLGTENITINAVYTAIEYTATFVADNVTVDTVNFTVETDSITEPTVPLKTGYTGAWEAYTLGTENITVNVVYTAIEYTATFVADSVTVDTVTFTVETVSITEPTVPAKTGYTGAWESYTLGANNITINAVYTAIEYTATFVADNVTVDTVTFTVETDSITEPTVPAKTGYTGAWDSYTLGANNITINAVYTAIEYTATFVADSVTVDTVNFTVETVSITEPTVPAKTGYTGAWDSYTLGANNITINAVYTAIEYTATFVADSVTVDTVNFTVETASVAEPTVPEKTGYTGAWEDYTLGTNNITINAVYTAIVYTATFKVDGVAVDTALFTVITEYITEPTVPVKAGYTGEWENYTLGTSDITVNAVYTAIEYTATFVADSVTVDTVTFTVETDNITEPTVPAKTGYTGAWDSYTLGANNITVNAVYTAIEYSATFVADSVTVDTVNFTVETDSITEPTVPAKTGYTGAWDSYTLGANNITVNAVYTAIEYSATFVADNVTVDTVTFTVETVSIEEPEVPVKAGYTGVWESYALGANNITINAVYTEDEPEPEPEPSVFTMTGTTITGVTDNTITSAVIPSGVTAVADGAFANCSLLTSVTIPTSVTSFGSGAFTGCTALSSVYYAGTVENWCGISFGGNSTTNANPLVFAHDLYINDEKVTTLTIPGTVTTINSHAFEGCSCTEVVLSEGVETIGRYAFENCTSMTKFTFGVSATSIPKNMFVGCSVLTTIKYAGTVEEWENVTKGANWVGDAQATKVKCKGGETVIE